MLYRNSINNSTGSNILFCYREMSKHLTFQPILAAYIIQPAATSTNTRLDLNALKALKTDTKKFI